ncbi:MAG: histidinol-phosphate transaminase [Desulfobacterales bacterium]|nr:histidinol-phosphate transaminase [Desulfobacterales bacterium]MBS3756653.1 histidinol-phosphate transaminase [Desulfobacterales bacterium]
MKLNIPDYIRSIKPYKPGKPIEELEREYGISGSIKLASNENPLGSSPKALFAMQAAMEKLNRYPDGSGYYLVQKLAGKLGVDPGCIVLGNGSDEIIGMLTRALMQPGEEAIMTEPSFLMYEIMVRSVGAEPVFVPLKSLFVDLDEMAGRITDKTRIIFLNNPANPTGTIISKAEFSRFMEQVPEHVAVVIDEAYIEFAADPDCLDSLAWAAGDRAVAVLRTFSKAYGLAGIRIGYGVMPGELAELLHRVRQPFNANALAQAGARAALDDDAFLEQTVSLVRSELEFLYAGLEHLGVNYFPSEANFFLIDVQSDAEAFFEAMLRQGVIVRSMASYGYPEYIRINAGTREENQRFLTAFEKVMNQVKG